MNSNSLLCKTLEGKVKNIFEVNNLNPTGIYLLKVNNRNTRLKCKICSKVTIKTLVFLLLTLNIFYTFF